MPKIGSKTKKHFSVNPNDVGTQPYGYQKIKLSECIDEICRTDLFQSCQSELKKTFNNKNAFLLSYELGAPIIRTENSELKDSFILPDGTSAAEKLGLKSNPLFLVIKGYVEVHRMLMLGKKSATIPIVTFEPFSTFGEFEVNLDKNAGWRPYIAEATSGWRTVECNKSFGGKKMWQDITGQKWSDEDWKDINTSDLGPLLHKSFKKFLEENGELSYATQLIIIPQSLLRNIILKVPKVVINLYRILSEHARTHIALSVTEGRDIINHETISNHFVNMTISRCLEGKLPVLVPCTRFPELCIWWKLINKTLMKNTKANLPYIFYVPAMHKIATCASTDPLKDLCTPLLSRSMIRVYTRDLAMGEGKIKSLDFCNQTKKVAKDVNFYLERLEKYKLEDRVKILSLALDLQKNDVDQVKTDYKENKRYSSLTFNGEKVKLNCQRERPRVHLFYFKK